MAFLFDKYGYIAQRPVAPERWASIAPDMPPGQSNNNLTVPPGMLVVENFLDLAWRQALLRECEAAPGMAHGVGLGGTRAIVEQDMRRSEHVDVRGLKVDVADAMRQLLQQVVAPHFHAKIEWYERPEILRYREGGKYVPHADAENWDPTTRRWKRVINRDLSVLVYLNDDFEGGEISFSNFGFDIKPSAGLLVAFPADHRYLHEAKALKSGVRYAVVSWAAIIGGPRVESALSPNIIKV